MSDDGEVMKMTATHLNVINAAKAWFRARYTMIPLTKAERRLMPNGELRIYDAVLALLRIEDLDKRHKVNPLAGLPVSKPVREAPSAYVASPATAAAVTKKISKKAVSREALYNQKVVHGRFVPEKPPALPTYEPSVAAVSTKKSPKTSPKKTESKKTLPKKTPPKKTPPKKTSQPKAERRTPTKKRAR